MPDDYTSSAQGADSILLLQAAMNIIDDYAQSEIQLQPPLRTSEKMWTTAGTAIGDVLATFPQVAGDLLTSWRSPADSSLFQQAADATTASLTTSRDSIGGPGGRSTGGFSIPDTLFKLNDVITLASSFSAMAKAELDQAVVVFNVMYPPAGEGGANPAVDAAADRVTAAADIAAAAAAKAAAEKQFVEAWRPRVVQAGQGLNILAREYQTSGEQILASAQNLKWAGPGSGNTAPGAGGPGTNAAGPTPAGGPTGAEPAGGPGATDAQPGGADAAGADAAGADAEMAGAGAAGGDAAAADAGTGAGGLPTGAGGTGLAGLDTLPMPSTVRPGSFPTQSLPTTPITSLPPGVIPIPPLTPIGPGMTIGKGKVPGPGGLVGGLGGGGLGRGGLAGSKGINLPSTNLPSIGDQAIPRAGEQLTTPQQATTGRAPVAPGSTGLPTTATPAGAGGGAPPPMMPPGGMGAGGNGRGGKPGTTPVRPNGRGRNRQTGETPGVPVGLRGKAGKGTAGAFPSVPANTRRRQDKDQPAETLQLLDEELWKVEEAETAAPTQVRRLAT